jgi:zinc/manganese transport system ATP-binding protein
VTNAVIRLDNVSVAYGKHAAVTGVSGSFAPGSLTAIAGPNGAGKTTLLKALIGELPLASGRIDMGELATHDFGYLPQAAEIDRSFPLTVADTVLLGAWRETGAFCGVGRSTARRASEALAAVGLAGFGRHAIGSLSAGQFQRVLFARLFLQDAKVILLDEPFTAIDARTTNDLLAIVEHWHCEGRTVIAVLHNFDQVRKHFTETLLLAREVIAGGPTASTATRANLTRARTVAEDWDGNATVIEMPNRRVA